MVNPTTPLLDRDSAMPMYRQLSQIIRRQVQEGELKPGDKLPTETALMELYGTSRITVRSAIEELVDSGTLVRAQGKGTFVKSSKEMYTANDRVGFSRSVQLAGKTSQTKLLEIQMVRPTLDDIQFLKVPEKQMVLSTKRLRLVDDIPILIETNHYTSEFDFLMEEDLNGSLFGLLHQKHGIQPRDKLRTLEVTTASAGEADLLGLEKGTPLLLFVDYHVGEDGRPLYISRQLYCTDRLKFYI